MNWSPVKEKSMESAGISQCVWERNGNKSECLDFQKGQDAGLCIWTRVEATTMFSIHPTYIMCLACDCVTEHDVLLTRDNTTRWQRWKSYENLEFLSIARPEGAVQRSWITNDSTSRVLHETGAADGNIQMKNSVTFDSTTRRRCSKKLNH